jgi:methionine-rich copper-binding protein CopC
MPCWFTRLPRLWFAAFFALSGTILMSIWFVGVASAHASYVSSDPASGAVVATAPTMVTVHFAEDINPQGANGVPSSLAVYHEADAKNASSFDEEAKIVSTGKTQFPLSDAKTMTISMQGDGKGIYAVLWHTVSADDGDPDSGVFFFGVGTGNVLGNSSTPATSAATNSSSGMPIWVTIVVGVVALVLGGGIVVGLRWHPQAAGAVEGESNVPSPPGGTPAEKR